MGLPAARQPLPPPSPFPARPEKLSVLAIAQDADGNRRLAEALRDAGVAVAAATALAEGDAAARAGGHSAIVLALAGWEAEALGLLARWRADGLSVPVLLLTGPEGHGGVRGLDLGADGFLPRDVTADAVLGHLRALARRAEGGPVAGPAALRFHDLEIDLGTGEVRRGGRPVVLTRTEQALLRLLAGRPGQVISRQEIEEHLYGAGTQRSRATVPTCVAKLRTKIDGGAELPLILTRRGKGYLLRGDEPAAPDPGDRSAAG
jgi:two-component system, OmpR family, response regulator MprA